MIQKVNLERFVAAILDAVILAIVSLIPTIIYFVFTGFESINNYLLNSQMQSGNLDEVLSSDYAIILTIGELVLAIIYFSYIPYKMNGQTFGKKILKIKAVDEVGENPSFKQHLMRAIQNWTTYFSAPLLFLLYINQGLYLVLSGLGSVVLNILIFASYIMLLAREDGKGLHDLWSGTQVVKADVDFSHDFLKKTTQMGEWADIEHDNSSSKDDDPWKY